MFVEIVEEVIEDENIYSVPLTDYIYSPASETEEVYEVLYNLIDKYIKNKRYVFLDVVSDCGIGMIRLYGTDRRLSKMPLLKDRWIEDGYLDLPCVCSHCGAEGNPNWSFCPICGTKWNSK